MIILFYINILEDTRDNHAVYNDMEVTLYILLYKEIFIEMTRDNLSVDIVMNT